MKKYLWAAVIAMTSLSAGMLSAQKDEPPKSPCAQFGVKFCSSIKTTHKFLNCLYSHRKELSKVCAAKVGLALTAKKNVQDACKEDEGKFCKDADGKNIRCLFSHDKQLSPSCRRAMAGYIKTMSIVPKRVLVHDSKPPKQGKGAKKANKDSKDK